MKRGGPAGPPASCHLAITNPSPMDARTCPARGGAIIGELMTASPQVRNHGFETTNADRTSIAGVYFAASCAHFASVLRKAFAAGCGSNYPVSAVRHGTIRP